ncbi:hypothetical protein LCGC14_2501700 [marine sediment metagenome]|uniref:Uncharacterized protein n=1 Tax=marine sediment metagenome TaxID=412755 RepID=A0A0F9DDG6_9ZZZZ
METPKAPRFVLEPHEIQERLDADMRRRDHAESLPGRPAHAESLHGLYGHTLPFAECWINACWDASAENLANARRFARAYTKEEQDGI